MTIGNPANRWLVGVVTSALISSATLWEGTKYYAYKDIANIPTVCQGHTGNGIVFGRKYSTEECNTFLRTDLIKHSNGILSCVKTPLKENEFNALVLFAFNVGVYGACNSRAVALFNTGNAEAGCRAIAFSPSGSPVWAYVNGNQFSKGLHNRRLYEMKMCQGDSNG